MFSIPWHSWKLTDVFKPFITFSWSLFLCHCSCCRWLFYVDSLLKASFQKSAFVLFSSVMVYLLWQKPKQQQYWCICLSLLLLGCSKSRHPPKSYAQPICTSWNHFLLHHTVRMFTHVLLLCLSLHVWCAAQGKKIFFYYFFPCCVVDVTDELIHVYINWNI